MICEWAEAGAKTKAGATEVSTSCEAPPATQVCAGAVTLFCKAANGFPFVSRARAASASG